MRTKSAKGCRGEKWIVNPWIAKMRQVMKFKKKRKKNINLSVIKLVYYYHDIKLFVAVNCF